MKLKQHLQNQSLEQLEIDWRSLTFAQRITLRLMAEADIARQNTISFAQKVYQFPLIFLSNLYSYQAAAHWVEPHFLEKKKK
jgi:hypothetical protein